MFWMKRKPDHKATLGLQVDQDARTEQVKLPPKVVTVTEHYDQQYLANITWLNEREANLIDGRAKTAEQYERYMAETDEDLRQLRAARAANEAARQVLADATAKALPADAPADGGVHVEGCDVRNEGTSVDVGSTATDPEKPAAAPRRQRKAGV